MKISGEDAKNWKAVSLVDLCDVNKGDLTEADDQTGEVSYKDRTGEIKKVVMGPYAIKLIKRR